jgi:sec-independent protein translocase protein TatC
MRPRRKRPLRPRPRTALDETKLPLTAHLAELRTRLFWVIGTWAVASMAAWEYRDTIFGYLLRPATIALGPEGGTLQALAPTEIFITHIKCAALAGFFLSLPMTFWHAWAFVAPGLYPSEKRTALPFVIASTLLFLGGAAFGHTFVFGLIYQFFAGFSSDYVRAAWTMQEVFSMSVNLLLAFGLGFELPILIYFLAAAGLVEPRALLRGAKYGLLGSFIAGAILTPPDVVSQVFLATPLFVLYLLGVGAAYLFAPRRKADRTAAADEAVASRGAS